MYRYFSDKMCRCVHYQIGLIENIVLKLLKGHTILNQKINCYIYIYLSGRKIFTLDALNTEVKINAVFTEHKPTRDARIRFRMRAQIFLQLFWGLGIYFSEAGE